ncbi:MAG: hypothetical protein ACK496_10335 [Acidobacteriota bacterium]
MGNLAEHAHGRADQVILRDPSLQVLLLQDKKTAAEAMPFSVLQTDASAADAQAEKRHSSVNRRENRGAILQLQPEVLRQKMADSHRQANALKPKSTLGVIVVAVREPPLQMRRGFSQQPLFTLILW